MEQHLTAEVLRRLAQRQLPREELATVLGHLAACAACAALGRATTEDDARRIQDLLAGDASESSRHLTEAELFDWVNGRERDDVRAHLAECDVCRSDAEDLQQLRSRTRRRPWLWLAAAATIAAVAISIVLLLRAPSTQPVVVETATVPVPPTPTVTAHGRADWDALVEQTLASSRLPFPADLALIEDEPGRLRGDDDPVLAELEPAGVVIDTPRPEFRWPPVEGATHVVSVFDGETEVARSGSLGGARWKPPQPLPRGRTYTWQVEASRAGNVTVLPALPAPQARFRVLAADQSEQLAEARRLRPDDHLLLAVLYARAGMKARAREHLERLDAATDPRVRRLLENTF